MSNDEIMLKIENVSKVYKLGEIGGTTLRDELQRLNAKIRNKPDPTKKIGSKDYNKGEKFLALNNVSFEVKKGERIGIIGHNGAGKSTLLKLISRVTGPTSGNIYLNGRVASMLEVGTGFHQELTGRENVYMNGAILGMTKKEIDSKMEDIIEFSEVRQFIDTPVKRYSSGMYVKLAFSVAAHLDSEIMIMDEVLAVGDMAFQRKCLQKMKNVSETLGRTILYVSHNMLTIRELCDRVIVLDHGAIIFDGNVEEGINKYLGVNRSKKVVNDLSLFLRNKNYTSEIISMKSLTLVDSNGTFSGDQRLVFDLEFECTQTINNLMFRFTFLQSEVPVMSSFTDKFTCEKGEKIVKRFDIDISSLVPNDYCLKVVAMEFDSNFKRINHDYVDNALYFDVVESHDNKIEWLDRLWGCTKGPATKIIK